MELEDREWSVRAFSERDGFILHFLSLKPDNDSSRAARCQTVVRGFTGTDQS